MSIKIEGGGSKENIIKSGTSNELLYNDEEIFLKKDLLDFVHPVGSIYWSSNDTDPGILFGGTWQQIKDRFVLAAGDSYTVNNTGGAATVTLSVDNMPSHNHSFSGNTGEMSGATSGWWNMTGNKNGRGSGGRVSNYEYENNNGCSWYNHNPIRYTINLSHNHYISGTTSSSGSGTAHNNMPPYIVKYCWERIA